MNERDSKTPPAANVCFHCDDFLGMGDITALGPICFGCRKRMGHAEWQQLLLDAGLDTNAKAAAARKARQRNAL